MATANSTYEEVRMAVLARLQPLTVAVFGLILGAAAVYGLVLATGRIMLPTSLIPMRNESSAGNQSLPSLDQMEEKTGAVLVHGDRLAGPLFLGLRDISLGEDGSFTMEWRGRAGVSLSIEGIGRVGESVSEGLFVWFVWDNADYTARRGECAIRFDWLEPQEITAVEGGVSYGPKGSAALQCGEVHALRSDQIIGIEGVFRFDRLRCDQQGCR